MWCSMGSGHTGREKVRKQIEARGADLEFLPSYSPDLNPIEEAFSNDVTNAGPVPCGEYPDHVEAYGIEIRFALGEVLMGEPAEGGLLSGRDGFERVAEASRTTQFNLDEDEDFFFADDHVDLPAARPVVALDEPVAAPGQVAQREVLPPRSGRLSLVSPPPRRSLGGGRGTGLVLRGHFDVRRCHSHGCARTRSRHGAPRGHASRRPARLWPPR